MTTHLSARNTRPVIELARLTRLATSQQPQAHRSTSVLPRSTWTALAALLLTLTGLCAQAAADVSPADDNKANQASPSNRTGTTVAAPIAGATRLQDLFDGGNQAFFSGDHDAAIAKYETLIAAGVRDPNVYFNLAASYGRTDRLGHAVLYLARAARLSPQDDEIQSQLRKVRETLAKREASRAGEATVRTRPPLREALLEGAADNTLAIGLLVFELLCLGSLWLRRTQVAETRRLAAMSVAIVSGLVALGCAAALWAKSGAGRVGPPSIVLVREELREGPDTRASSRAQVPEGALASVLLREGGWIQVQLDDGARGWVPADHVGLVVPD